MTPFRSRSERSPAATWAGYAWAYFYLVAGALIAAAGLNGILAGNRLADGGLTGLSLVVSYLTGVNPGVFYFLFNVPLLGFGWRLLGRRFAIRTVVGAVLLSVFLVLTERFRYPFDDLLLASLYGGVVIGLGLGLMFRSGGSSGGLDIVARYLSERRGIPVAQTFLITDGMILAVVWVVLGVETVFYSLIVSFLLGRMIDWIQEGPSRAIAVLVVTGEPEAVADHVLRDLDRGVTLVPAVGAYSGAARRLVLVVLRRGELSGLKDIVAEVDPRAFVVIGEVAEVLGEGFGPSHPDRQGRVAGGPHGGREHP